MTAFTIAIAIVAGLVWAVVGLAIVVVLAACASEPDDEADTAAPDEIVVNSLRWACRCGGWSVRISSLVPGLGLRFCCPRCGSTCEWLGPERSEG
jgi:hypothetical protein